jgi:hypothetical protein
MLTRGRTVSSVPMLELHVPLLALVSPDELGRTATPEDRRIVELCQTPTSLAEVAARMETPVGVARVLVGDLIEAGMMTARGGTGPRADHRDPRLLERLLEGIRAL